MVFEHLSLLVGAMAQVYLDKAARFPRKGRLGRGDPARKIREGGFRLSSTAR